jgi:hypothetical protein
LRLSRLSEIIHIEGTNKVHVTSGQEEGVMSVFTFEFFHVEHDDE